MSEYFGQVVPGAQGECGAIKHSSLSGMEDMLALFWSFGLNKEEWSSEGKEAGDNWQARWTTWIQ